MSAEFSKIKLQAHVQICPQCLELYSTLTKSSKKTLLVLFYKKKCYQQFSETNPLPFFTLRIKEISEEIQKISLSTEMHKCEQIATHSLFHKR